MAKVTNLAEKRAPAKPSFMDKLKETAKPKETTTKKSSVPILNDAPENIRQTVDDYIDAKEREKIAASEMEAHAIVIVDWVKPIQDDGGFKGAYQNSYAVPGMKAGNRVRFTTKNMFKINAEDGAKIEEIMGDCFGDLVEKKFEVKLKPEVFQNDELQSELMELVGDRWNDFFATEEKLKVKDDFDKRIFGALGKEKLQELRVFVQQYKPSLT